MTVVELDLSTAGVVPLRTNDPDHARELLLANGAAILTGIEPGEAGAVAAARSVLGDLALDVRPQFRATQSRAEERLALIESLPADAPARRRHHYDRTTPLPPHNDGFAFADELPDRLFLCCVRPCPTGGASWLVDGVALLELLAGDPTWTAVARAAWEEEIEHTDPAYDPYVGPIARHLDSGRVIVRMNPYQRAPQGAPADRQALADAWLAACSAAAVAAPRFRLVKGDLLCADNYRFGHGRDAYDDPERTVISTWAWTTTAMAVPALELDLL